MMDRTWLGVATLLAVFSSQAAAQNYPSRPIEMIIPFTAGSGLDVNGRAMATALTEQLGANVVVLNRDGVGGTIGFGTLATAAPDGYTIGFGPTTPIANAPYLVKGVRYTADSFSYICQAFEAVFAIAVGPSSKLGSVRELFAAARENPGKLTYGSAGIGTIPHLSVAHLGDALGLQFQHVPFRGDAALVPALLRGDTDFAAAAVATIRNQPALRALAVFADERHPAYPDVSSVQELGVAAGVPPGHVGLFAPSGLPSQVQGALERACATAIKGDTLRQVATSTGQSIKYLSSAQFQAQTVADYKFKGELIRKLGLLSQ